jgi:predicted RNase H-like nuclease (RuvC/YqgF family)
MGADHFLNRPIETRELWEQVRDMEEELARVRRNVRDLNKIIEQKDDTIKSLKEALRELRDNS